MTSAASHKSVRLIYRYVDCSSRRRFSFSRSRVVYSCSVCTRALVGVPTCLPRSSSISHNCIRRGRFTFLHEKVAPPDSPKSDGAKPDGPKLETPKPTQASLATPPPNSLAMKIFFAAPALALAASTCTGLIMGWKYARRKSIVMLTIAAGVLIPAILVFVWRFPTRSFLRETQMTQSSSCSL
jgi:hypothetical protein